MFFSTCFVLCATRGLDCSSESSNEMREFRRSNGRGHLLRSKASALQKEQRPLSTPCPCWTDLNFQVHPVAVLAHGSFGNLMLPRRSTSILPPPLSFQPTNAQGAPSPKPRSPPHRPSTTACNMAICIRSSSPTPRRTAGVGRPFGPDVVCRGLPWRRSEGA